MITWPFQSCLRFRDFSWIFIQTDLQREPRQAAKRCFLRHEKKMIANWRHQKIDRTFSTAATFLQNLVAPCETQADGLRVKLTQLHSSYNEKMLHGMCSHQLVSERALTIVQHYQIHGITTYTILICSFHMIFKFFSPFLPSQSTFQLETRNSSSSSLRLLFFPQCTAFYALTQESHSHPAPYPIKRGSHNIPSQFFEIILRLLKVSSGFQVQPDEHRLLGAKWFANN